MNHNHTHTNHCNHELKHCAHCDVAYCLKCSKEWKNTWWNTSSGSAITYYSNPLDNKVNCGGSDTSLGSGGTTHNHG